MFAKMLSVMQQNVVMPIEVYDFFLLLQRTGPFTSKNARALQRKKKKTILPKPNSSRPFPLLLPWPTARHVLLLPRPTARHDDISKLFEIFHTTTSETTWKDVLCKNITVQGIRKCTVGVCNLNHRNIYLVASISSRICWRCLVMPQKYHTIMKMVKS